MRRVSPAVPCVCGRRRLCSQMDGPADVSSAHIRWCFFLRAGELDSQ
uniref:Uncharacterized protein n=1 Tax=Anguilla anguilla TaxID=7936 RepID=A0A0E9VUB0_ANGAN